MPDEIDRASERETAEREYRIAEARRAAALAPVPQIDCRGTCSTGPYGKECEYYRDCLVDWERRTK